MIILLSYSNTMYRNRMNNIGYNKMRSLERTQLQRSFLDLSVAESCAGPSNDRVFLQPLGSYVGSSGPKVKPSENQCYPGKRKKKGVCDATIVNCQRQQRRGPQLLAQMELQNQRVSNLQTLRNKERKTKRRDRRALPLRRSNADNDGRSKSTNRARKINNRLPKPNLRKEKKKS